MTVEQRIETLDRELGVLKGDLKQTLIDLRATLMRADSPLSDDGSTGATTPAPMAELSAPLSPSILEPPAPVEEKQPPVETATSVAADAEASPLPVESPPVPPQSQAPPQMAVASPGNPIPVDAKALPDDAVSRLLAGDPPAPGQGEGPGPVAMPQPSPEAGETGSEEDSWRSFAEAVVSRSTATGKPQPLEPDELTGRIPGEMPEELREAVHRVAAGDDGLDLITSFRRSVLDVNLVCSLLRWVNEARYRLGEEGLEALVDTYALTGQAVPGLKELVMRLATATDAPEGSVGDTTETWINLMLQFHGIVTGLGASLTIPQHQEGPAATNGLRAGDDRHDGWATVGYGNWEG